MSAWSKGMRFLAAQPGGHAVLLLSLGLILPVGIQIGERVSAEVFA